MEIFTLKKLGMFLRNSILFPNKINFEYEFDDEEVNYAVSDDGGKTWSDCIKGNMNPENGAAVSHGVFLIHKEELYAIVQKSLMKFLVYFVT